MDAINWVREIFARHAGEIFLVDTVSGRSLTFHDLEQAAKRVAADFERRGMAKGDRVAVVMHNSLELAEIYFGILFAGLVAVPINPAVSAREAAWIINSSGAKLLMVSPDTTQLVPEDLGSDCQILCLQSQADDASGREAWHPNRLPEGDEFVPLEHSSPEDTMCMVFTSGTTAQPKGVVHSISDLIDNGRLFTQYLGIGPNNRFYGILAMAYLGGYYNLLFLPFTAGASVALSRAFDASLALDFWGPAIKHQVNTLWLVPTIISILLQMDRTKTGEEFCREKVELCLCGTAPLLDKTREDFTRRYGLQIYNNYGLSETFFISTQSRYTKLSSVGRPLPGVQVAIMDNHKDAVELGREGEVHVSTPYLMKGYFDTQAQKVDLIPDGQWFATGDLGMVTPSGELVITGRIKDLVIKGGVNVSPTQVENALLEHPMVKECAVVGIPHPVYGEEVAAVLLLEQGRLSEAETSIKEHCEKHLSGAQIPARFFEVEELPRNPAGKVKKPVLRSMLLAKLGLSEISAHTEIASPTPVLGSRVRRSFERPDADQVKELATFGTALISDCQNRMGVMRSYIRPLTPGRSFAGPAFTVEEVEGGNLMSHLALELVQPGDVLVIDAKGITSRACFGGLQLLAAAKRKVAGLVMDGAVRDLDEVRTADLPVYARGASPAGPFKGWGGNINQPISCGGAAILPGDILVGDDDGVVVVRRDVIEKLLGHCRQRAQLESKWYDRVENGESSLDAVGLRQTLDKLDITYE